MLHVNKKGPRRAIKHLETQRALGHLEDTWALEGHSGNQALKTLRHSNT